MSKRKKVADHEVTVSIRIDQAFVNELDKASISMRISRSEIIRYLIESFCEALPGSCEFWMGLESEKKKRLIRYRRSKKS